MNTESDWQQYNIVMPARIVEYFPETQLATVRPSGERVFNSATDSQSLEGEGLLYDVPVHTPQGGNYCLTMPVTEGDTCLLMFSQFGYDHWLWKNSDVAGEVAGNPAPWLRRKFSKKDGLALVGFSPVPNAIPDYHATATELRSREDRTQRVSIQPNENIEIWTPQVLSLNCDRVLTQARYLSTFCEVDHYHQVNGKTHAVYDEEIKVEQFAGATYIDLLNTFLDTGRFDIDTLKLFDITTQDNLNITSVNDISIDCIDMYIDAWQLEVNIGDTYWNGDMWFADKVAFAAISYHSGFQIRGVGDPLTATDAANRQWVEANFQAK